MMAIMGESDELCFALCAKLLKFLKSHNHQHSKHFEDSSFILTFTLLADIFGALNQLSFQIQGGDKNAIEAEEKMSTFLKEIEAMVTVIGK